MRRHMRALLAAFVVMSTLTLGGGQALASDQFTDVADTNIFHDNIGWLADAGITRGCNPPTNDQFCPDDFVTRGQMAAFFVRGLSLAETDGGTDFTDTDGDIFEQDILKLSASGITRGCNPPDNDQFCPNDFVTRGQMAAFFVRGLGLTDMAGTDFTDTDGDIFEQDILKLSASGITRGCNPPDNDQFCPNDFVTREQMAAFFNRADDGVSVQILAINDFHGNIATTDDWGPDDRLVGRADFLAGHVVAKRAESANTIMVSAGDLIGASPLVSAIFHDEPTIEAMNMMGLELNAVGNHEFDEGPDELLRMQEGGSHPVDGDFGGDVFGGADFEFLAANVVVDATSETIFPEYSVKTYGGIDVAFIGMTLEGTPIIVTPAGTAGLTFLDEVDTVNALIPELQAMGIEAIVVLLHEGGFERAASEDECAGLSGPLADIVPALDDAVDLVIAGHTNDEAICEVDGKWVTMADNRARLFTDIDVGLSRLDGDLNVMAIDNVPTYQDEVTADAEVTALIEEYVALAAPLANTVVGTISADITETETPAGESPLGNVIADAQLEATEGAGDGNADVAFMNPGGIRTDLIAAEISGTEAVGEITYGEAFAVQPFNNDLWTMTLTGQQIHDLLEQQFYPDPADNTILQVSAGFTYTWDAAAAVGDKVDPDDIKIGGVAIVLTDPYRVTVNNFLAGGGDGFTALTLGTDVLVGVVDVDAFADYLGAHSPLAPPATGRITVVNN